MNEFFGKYRGTVRESGFFWAHPFASKRPVSLKCSTMKRSSELKRRNPGLSAYNATKFGLMGFSEALMLELRHDRIKVTTICPGSSLLMSCSTGAPIFTRWASWRSTC